jgi:zinc protease
LGHFGQADIELALSAARPHCLRVKLVSRFWRWLPPAVLLGAGALVAAGTSGPDYAIVVSRATQADRDWRRVVEVLREKHQGAVIVFDASVEEAQPRLRALFPRYACFVARPSEVSRRFVAQVHRLTCKLDDDPYPGCFWGILTGYDAANALRLAEHQEPLIVRKVVAGTEIPLDMCEEGRWYSELEAGRWTRKEKGGEPEALSGASDTTEALVNALTEYQADLFVTSGHATERDWQIGYRYRNGQFRCEDGVLCGLDTHGKRFPIRAPNPKVYLPVGNCLMGHIDGTNAMALAFLNSAGVQQMVGYTVTTWYGYAGWGCLDYFLEQPGRYTFAEAFLANEAALIHRLQQYFPDLVSAELDDNGQTQSPIRLTEAARAAGLTADDARGLLYDRDTLAFYGDPAWVARMADRPKAWDQRLTETNGLWTLEVSPNRGERTFAPISLNGSQRGGRPIVQFFPCRLEEARVIEGADLKPVITGRFILVPNPRECDPARNYRIAFRAKVRP